MPGGGALLTTRVDQVGMRQGKKKRAVRVGTIETLMFGRSGHKLMQRAAEREGKCRVSGLYSTDALAGDVIWRKGVWIWIGHQCNQGWSLMVGRGRKGARPTCWTAQISQER